MSDTPEGTCGECPYLADAGAHDALVDLHRYLFPDRYDENAELYDWHAGTIEDVAAKLERALPNAPRPRREDESAAERNARVLREGVSAAGVPGGAGDQESGAS
jgi:hypothetical protein